MNINIKIPYRLYPGGLSVSRSFGDASAKLKEFQGNNKVLIAEPEISMYKPSNTDFYIIGCDGIFDVLSSKEVV
jgi:protein phosphatase 2C family protein 2/3